jgi:hypothetical protein
MNDNQADRRPLLRQRGGVWYLYRWGSLWMTWPFGKLTVFRGQFEVNGARFTAQNVLALERITFLFSPGLRIVHSNPNTCKEIVFWSPNFALLQVMLAQAGFSITKPSEHWRKRQLISWTLTILLGIVVVAIALLVWGPEMIHSN